MTWTPDQEAESLERLVPYTSSNEELRSILEYLLRETKRQRHLIEALKVALREDSRA